MNQSHAIAGVSGVSTTAMLATVLQHFQAVDTATASAEAGLVVLAIGAVAGIVQVILAAKPDPCPEPAQTEAGDTGKPSAPPAAP